MVMYISANPTLRQVKSLRPSRPLMFNHTATAVLLPLTHALAVAFKSVLQGGIVGRRIVQKFYEAFTVALRERDLAVLLSQNLFRGLPQRQRGEVTVLSGRKRHKWHGPVDILHTRSHTIHVYLRCFHASDNPH